jgi:hypothetical protein
VLIRHAVVGDAVERGHHAHERVALAAVGERVRAVATVVHVVAVGIRARVRRQERVVPGTAVQDVRAVLVVQFVVALAAGHRVVARTAEQRVVAVAGVDRVGAATTVEVIGLVVAGDGVTT